MNTNEELKTRPDFEAMFKNGAFKSHPLNIERDAVSIGFAESVCEDIWTTHVEPLQAENARLKNDLLDALDLKAGNGPTALSMLHSENQKLREQMNSIKNLDIHGEGFYSTKEVDKIIDQLDKTNP